MFDIVLICNPIRVFRPDFEKKMINYEKIYSSNQNPAIGQWSIVTRQQVTRQPRNDPSTEGIEPEVRFVRVCYVSVSTCVQA